MQHKLRIRCMKFYSTMINNKGQPDISGKSHHSDLPWPILSMCLEHGGDEANCHLPVAFNTVTQETGFGNNEKDL